jgi:hypothetical protein
MPEMTPEDTVEYWLGRYRAEGAKPENLRDFLSTVSPDIPQAIAARQYIAELEHAQYAAKVSLAHAEDRPAREQAERHHLEDLGESRKQSRRAEVVAWCSLLVSLVALVLSRFPSRRDAAGTAALPPAASPPLEQAVVASPTGVQTEQQAQQQIAEQQAQQQIAEQQRQQQIAELIAQHRFAVGMTANEVRQAIGEPREINRSVNSNSISEQWVYSDNLFLYLDNGVLRSFQENKR